MILIRRSVGVKNLKNILISSTKILCFKSAQLNFKMNRWGQYNNPWDNNVNTPRSLLDFDINLFKNDYNHNMRGEPVRSFQPLSMGCGELRINDVGKLVQLTGRYSRKRIGRFAEIKDRTGHTQIVIEDKHQNIARRFAKMPADCVITIVGTVYNRPHNSINASVTTGEIEVEVEDIINIDFPYSSRQSNKRSYSTMTETRNTGITSTEYKITKSDNILKYFDNREYTCNDLNLDDVGKQITLIGWIPNISKVKFQQLKDGYGQTQILFDDEMFKIQISSIPENTVLLVKGIVLARPPNNINSKYPTGAIEVHVGEIKVLNPDDPYDGPVKDKISKMSIEDVKKSDNENSKDFKNANVFTKVADLNKFTIRTHNCAELRISNVNEKVVLCGWLEFQRMNKFLVLRDGYGHIQIMLPETCEMKYQGEISLETILKVEGRVVPRPSNMQNPAMPTGDIEIYAETIEVLNNAKKNLPFEVRHFNRAQETLRLEHRYIDLRFDDMQKNLRRRSKVLMKMREYLINYLGFVEVETPTLFRKTPGGAQEFIVPSRKVGHFYSLTQSPQQFKQMLMAGAIDRYFQIARCYRDESTRPDRQPEFTQLDIELSFSNREHIMKLVEETLLYCWPEDLPKIEIPFKRITYDDAMKTYGSDKPDDRYGFKFQDVTEILKKNEKLSKDIIKFSAYAIVVKKPQSYFSQTIKIKLNKVSNDFPNSKFVISKVKDVNVWVTSLENLLSTGVSQSLQTDLCLENDDVVLLAYGPQLQTQIMLGRIRVTYIEIINEFSNNQTKPKKQQFNFLWVNDFPLFIKNDKTDKIESVHHPFTAPFEEDVDKLTNKNDILSIRSQAYDLVLNGEEIGGGSIRIHDKEMQKFILQNILKINHSHLEHLLNALESGCPPHGGIALGIDRLLSIMCNTKSIRDVIAFPKGNDGKDHLSKAPVPITTEEKKLYNIEIVEKEDSQK